MNVGVGYYNSYLILADKPVLIDTVPKEYSNALIENIKKHIDIKNINAIIINHTEYDRSSALSSILEINKNITIISSLSGVKNLEQQLNYEFSSCVAKSNMLYKLDNCLTLKFIITHNLNWPDSMMTYLEEEKILFSCDVFSNENTSKKEYFYENLYPMSSYIECAVNQLKNIEISKIYPGSGDILSNTDIINEYLLWSKEDYFKKIIVIYESNTGNNKILAKKIQDAVINEKIQCELIDISNKNKNDVLNSIYQNKGVVFVTPTHYRNIPKKLAELIININHYKLKNTLFASVGSYGWSGEAPNLIYSILKARHFSTYKSPYRVMFKPDDNDLLELENYISEFIKVIKTD